MPSVTSPAATSTHPDAPPFPPPSMFSILPDIYLLITRLDILQQPQPTTPGGTSLPAITAKDLPTLTHPIKQNIAKARAAVQALPDVERSVEEQQDEIQMLERRIAALKGRLGELGKIAGENRLDLQMSDVVMSGIEG